MPGWWCHGSWVFCLSCCALGEVVSGVSPEHPRVPRSLAGASGFTGLPQLFPIKTGLFLGSSTPDAEAKDTADILPGLRLCLPCCNYGFELLW